MQLAELGWMILRDGGFLIGILIGLTGIGGAIAHIRWRLPRRMLRAAK